MSWRSILPMFVMLLGAVLFLYGANYFDTTTGWAGVLLMAGGFIVEIAAKLLKVARKKEEGLEAVEV